MNNAKIITRKTRFTGDAMPSRSVKKYTICGKMLRIKSKVAMQIQETESSMRMRDLRTLVMMNTRVKNDTTIRMMRKAMDMIYPFCFTLKG